MTGKKAGRPEGTKNPNPVEQIKRKAPRIYSALLRQAENGDAAAARLCFDIAKHPDNFPGANGKR